MKKNGFTLMEILLVVGILGMVVTLISQVFITTTKTNTKTTVRSDIEKDGNFSLDVMQRMIRGASAITATCDGGITTTASIVITGQDSGTTTLTCVSDGIRARIASVSGQGTIRYLSGNTGTLSVSGATTCDDSSLIFSCPDPNGTQSPVTMTFALRDTNATMSFEGVATPRH